MTAGKKEKAVAPADKEKKPKLVRDSFTLPKGEYAAIDAIKERALSMTMAVKKSEVVRAALMSLAAMNDAQLKTALSAVPTLKTGRPSKEKATAPPAPPVAKPATKPPATRTPVAAKKAPVKRAPAAKKAVTTS